MEIRPIDVLRNIENHSDYWDIADYKLSKPEGEVVMKALRLLIKKGGDNAKAGQKKS